MATLCNKPAQSVDRLCDIDVYATKNMDTNTRPVAIYVKLIPLVNMTKSMLAVITCVFGHQRYELDKQQKDLET